MKQPPSRQFREYRWISSSIVFCILVIVFSAMFVIGAMFVVIGNKSLNVFSFTTLHGVLILATFWISILLLRINRALLEIRDRLNPANPPQKDEAPPAP